MMKNVNQMGERAAFTIVELLTVMAVIAILIGLLVPALGLVHDTAQDLQQKAQFHGINVGLELFKTEFGNYPESNDNQYNIPKVARDTVYTGANKLAEAMVGLDLMGFHSASEFKADGQGLDPLGGGGLIDLYVATTIDDREDRYVDLEKSNAFMMEEIYGAKTGSFTETNYVLCDSYAKRRTGTVEGKKTGMPILYYRADTKFKIQDSTIPDKSIFDYRDNEEIFALGTPDDAAYQHPLAYATDATAFDLAIINDQITYANVPYRSQTFILISAGKDGVYGNADDIYNFDKEK
ncbi:MAG: type II secretion system GspH family protein [Phycisphaerae bacterium]|nr:type II secretion system GspH family protein [Phycisphaerae bacterium]